MGFVVSILVGLILGSLVLAAALWLTGEVQFDRDTLVKCLGISFVTAVLGIVPVAGGLLALVVWIAAVMSLFEKTFGEAFLVGLACFGINLLLGMGVAFLMAGGA